MSNSIDILLVDGPANGHVMCMNRAQQTSKIETLVGGQGVITYVRKTHTSIDTGKHYHVAVPEGTTPTYDTIQAEIVMAEHQPAWDLN